MSSSEINNMLSAEKQLPEIVLQSLHTGEEAVFLNKGGSFIKHLLFYNGLIVTSLVGLYLYDSYSGHDYYGILDLIEKSKGHPEALILTVLTYLLVSLVAWFLSKDSQLLVITNESILFFWRALSFQKLELLRRIDLKDITSVNVIDRSTGTVEVHCTAPIKRLLFMPTAPQEVIEQINKAVKLRIDHNH